MRWPPSSRRRPLGSGSAFLFRNILSLKVCCSPKDDRLGTAAAPWRLLPGSVEHPGLHCGQWGPGGLCLHVSLLLRTPLTTLSLHPQPIGSGDMFSRCRDGNGGPWGGRRHPHATRKSFSWLLHDGHLGGRRRRAPPSTSSHSHATNPLLCCFL